MPYKADRCRCVVKAWLSGIKKRETGVISGFVQCVRLMLCLGKITGSHWLLWFYDTCCNNTNSVSAKKKHSLLHISGFQYSNCYFVQGQQHGVKAHASSWLPDLQSKESTDSVDQCLTHVSIIPSTVVPSHRLDKFLPTAKIAFGTGMQYGPGQSILVSICQNTIIPFYNLADCWYNTLSLQSILFTIDFSRSLLSFW